MTEQISGNANLLYWHRDCIILCMKENKTTKLKQLGKFGREISYFIPVFAGVYVIFNFISWAS